MDHLTLREFDPCCPPSVEPLDFVETKRIPEAAQVRERDPHGPLARRRLSEPWRRAGQGG